MTSEIDIHWWRISITVDYHRLWVYRLTTSFIAVIKFAKEQSLILCNSKFTACYFWKNFRITPYINYAFCVINYASALLSSKTMANSPEYCIYTSVMNTYCVNKRGFQFLSFFIFFYPSLSLFSPLIHLPLSPVPPGFLFPFFFAVVG